MKGREFIDKDVFALDEKIGKIKEIEVDPQDAQLSQNWTLLQCRQD
jgi:hypothetical protein